MADALTMARAHRDGLRARVEQARKRKAAADAAFQRVPPHDGRAQQDAGAERDEARRELETLEAALPSAEQALAELERATPAR